MPSPHPTSRSRAPISLTFVAASARETPRARVRGARGPGYDRLAVAFGQLPEALLVELAQGLQETFSPGETIVREGDPADRFYIIGVWAGRGDTAPPTGRRARAEAAGRRLLRRGRTALHPDADGNGAGGQRGPRREPRPRPVPSAHRPLQFNRGGARRAPRPPDSCTTNSFRRSVPRLADRSRGRQAGRSQG